MTTRSPLNAIGLFLLFVIDYAASGQYSGVLSNIYKKASQENRPLILVLDNTKSSNFNADARDSDYTYKTLELSPKKDNQRSKSYSAYSQTDKGDQLQLLSSLLQTLGQQNSLSKYQPSNSDKVHDHSFPRNRLRRRPRDRRDRRNKRDRTRLRSRSDNRDRRDRRDRFRLRSQPDNRNRDGWRDRLRFRSQLERDDRDRRDERNDQDRRDNEDNRYRDDKDDRNARDRYDLDKLDDRDESSRDRNNRDRRNQNRNNRDRRDQTRDHRGQLDRDRGDSIKAYVEKNRAMRHPHEIERYENNDRALRSSVVHNLLRISNNLRCDAQDQCVDDCDNNYDREKEADECAEACGEKYKCEEEKPDHISAEHCDFGDSCAESTEDENNPSTRGIKLDGNLT